MEPEDIHRTVWTLTVALSVGLMFAAAAAGSQSELTCEVKRQPDGSFLYKLSEPPRSTSCDTCWEDEKKFVIARDSPSNNSDLVLNVTSQSITLRDCQEYLHYTEDCYQDGFRDAHCRVNCSLYSADQPTKVNSTLTCIVGSWCPDPWTVWITGLSIPLAVAAGVVGLWLWKTGKCRRRESASESISYSPANGHIKTERVEGDDDVEQGHVIRHNRV